MVRRFTQEDVDERIVTAAGDTVGTVRGVEDGRATVERTDDDESLTDEIKEMLGWSDDDDTYELTGDDVEEYEDGNRIRLPGYTG
jgi:hypothetical protein